MLLSRQRRRDDVVGRLAARLSARKFPRLRPLRLPRRAGDQDLSDRHRRARRRRGWPGGGCTRPSSVDASSPSATMLAPPNSRGCGSTSCVGVFVISALSAVTAGSCSAASAASRSTSARPRIAGHRRLRGRRRATDGRPRHGRRRGRRRLHADRALHVAHLLGLPQPLKDTAQGLILIVAVAFGAWRRRADGIEGRLEAPDATPNSGKGRKR